MRFRRLEVSSYRAVDQAVLELGPGLNVLYGPNDLGKSTLASAMRAALLLPAESSAHQAFVPWHSAEPPRVQLSFERDGTLYRVTKVFGSGSLGTAHLESSADGLSFLEEERGRAVERRLRELLRWGIEPPGGKGGPRGLPESFLSHVLLGSQSDVPLILERSLEGDRDGSGRERLHEALQALSQDPVFKRVLDAAQARVDAAFTPTGRRRTGQSSPFFQIKEQITQLAQEAERLGHQRRESEEVQQRIASLSDQRLAIEADLAALEERVRREAAALEQLAARNQARERHARAERALAAERAERAELERLTSELTAERSAAEALFAEVARGAARRTEAEARALDAERALLALSSPAELERRQLERDALAEACRREREAQARAARVLELSVEVEAAEAALRAESAALSAAQEAEQASRRALSAADAELAALRELGAVLAFRECELDLEKARLARADADALREQGVAHRARAAAASEDAAVAALAALPQAALGALRELENEMRLAAARLEVGVSLALTLPEEQEVRLRVDGGREQRHVAGRETLRQRAKGRIVAALPGGTEIEATAGDPALREGLAQLERRWRLEAAPVLERSGVASVDALAARVDAARARQREIAEWLREATGLEARAAERREQASELEALEGRLEQRRIALGGIEPERLAALAVELPAAKAAGARGAATQRVLLVAARLFELRAIDGLLESRRAAAASARARLESALETHAAALVRSSTRNAALRDARDAALARRGAAWSEAAGGDAKVPALAQLKKNLAALEAASRAAASALETWEAERASERARAQHERDEAARELAAARAAHDARQAASVDARERTLTLEARVRERRERLDASERSAAARAELESAAAELARFGELDEITPEQHAQGQNELMRMRAELERAVAELRRAEGALGHVGGDVVVVRERQTEEALERARAQELEQEREYDAYRLLLETLRAVENEQGVHLGRALEAPVSERFGRLTAGRYRQVGLDGGLGLQGIAVAGRQRSYAELSEGTQEQLATILRLCIAEYLETALVLDDHLAQTHRERAEWFRSTLREAAARIQIVVLTARPEDYLEPEELCDGEVVKDTAASGVRAIDLARVIRRADYDRAAS